MPLDGRGGLVFSRLHGEPLHLHAVRTAAETCRDVVVRVDDNDLERVASDVARSGLDVSVLTVGQWWQRVRRSAPGPLLVHDPLCPLTPVDLLVRMLAASPRDPATSLVAFRPVTDTVKTVVEGAINATIDRSGLAALTSPALVAAEVMARARADDDPPPLHDVRTLLAWLRERGPVELVAAPGIGRRVDDASAVLLLECVDEVGRRVHH